MSQPYCLTCKRAVSQDSNGNWWHVEVHTTGDCKSWRPVQGVAFTPNLPTEEL